MNRLSLAVLAALTTLILAAPAGAVVAPDERPLPNIDVRVADGGPTTTTERRARAALERSLGDEGIVSNDRITGAARLVARTDGFLTGRRSAPPAGVALDYVRTRPEVFGLDRADLDRLRLTSRSRSLDDVTHLAYTQTYLGVAAYDNVLLANVAGDGRLLNVGGAAVSDLRVPSVTPDLTAATALAVARREVSGPLIAPRSRQLQGPERPTRFSNGDTARLTLFNDGTTTRLAWRLEVTGEHEFVYELVVDATSGRVLKRRSLTEFAAAQVYQNHPGAPFGGAPVALDLNLAGNGTWLEQPLDPTRLSGNNAHAYVDADATDASPGGVGPTPGDLEVPSSNGTDWDYPITPFSLPGCPPAPEQCTWDAGSDASRATNRYQAATQLFYLVNAFHDYLTEPPIGFTHDARNFELADADGAGPGLGGDPVMAETDNFLNPDGGAPTSTNNASMTTRPDGTPPRLEMFLFTNPSLNSADTADIVYHEYSHGLTNRLVGSGVGLDANQSRAMGEGWSDWYALDHLAAAGLVNDTAVDGELNIGGYLGDFFGTGGFRRQGIDCPVGSSAARCPGTPGRTGGYTLGDMGSVGSAFEVHDDGEIWAETLWDLRRALPLDARRLITAGLRLAPNNPSFLEARDAILLADRNAGGPHYEALWSAFAARGMGFSARTTSSAATTAQAATDIPPRLVHESTTISDVAGGDANDVPEPGETISIGERLRNPSPTSDVTGISATLSASTADVTVGQSLGTWPAGTIAARSDAVNSPPFEVTLGAGVSCDTDVQLSLAVTTNQGPFTIPLRVPIGSKLSSDVPKVIATPSAGVNSTLEFVGNGLVDKLEVRIPRLAHTWVGDLVVTLTNPSGTKVTLMERPGPASVGQGASGNDFVNLVFDDDAATPIASIPDASPPGGYTGRFRPTQPLSAFDGQDRKGIWTLNVRDAFPGDDSGTLYDWGIRPSSAECNRAPHAADDSHAVAGDQALQGPSVLLNDSDPDGDPLVAETATEAAHGSVALAADGTFTYTPAAGFRGNDSFTYRARDNGTPALTAAATVRISVGNRAPTAADDAYAAAAGEALNGSSVLANDSDPNGDALSASLVSPPAHGTLTLAPNGTFTYTPVVGFSGRDAFVYRASDDSLSSAAATATLTVATASVTPPLAPSPSLAPAKLEILRAGVSAGRLDVLASITSRASGSVRVRYRSAGRTTSFDAPISDGRISFRKSLPRSQRAKPTGIFTLSYAGSGTVLADSVRLRAAAGKARLVRKTSLIEQSGRLRVSGTISSRARGVVSIRFGYVTAGGATEFLSYTTRIERGRWSLAVALPAAAARAGGQLSIQYTGYEPLRIRGEQLARAVSPAG
jgi:subtilisin-like proprotein convertase family protein